MMDKLKINIYYKFQKGPWGGGNQFLKALRNYFISEKHYQNKIKNADIILFNSHHDLQKVLNLKKKFKNKVFIHRIDGPIGLYRGNNLEIDNRIYKCNNYIANGTIFQSNWSKEKNHSLGLKKKKYETVIMNTSDTSIFYPLKINRSMNFEKNKCKIIIISWSNNKNKGFDLYQYLDHNLDYNKYSATFVGNSQLTFENIKYVPPQNSYKLADLIRNHDIYLTGSKMDPCSNSLIEALSCGLPSVALNDGGHPEIIKKGGELFTDFNDCIEKLEMVRNHYSEYKQNITVYTMNDVGTKYLDFMERVLSAYNIDN